MSFLTVFGFLLRLTRLAFVILIVEAERILIFLKLKMLSISALGAYQLVGEFNDVSGWVYLRQLIKLMLHV